MVGELEAARRPGNGRAEAWSPWQVLVVALAGVLVGLLAGVVLATRVGGADGALEAPLGSTEAPVAVGDAHDVGSGWTLRIEEVRLDAGDEIAMLREANEPPGPNESYVLVTLDLRYDPHAAHQVIGQPQHVLLSLRDDRGGAYVPHQRSCGLIPNPIYLYPSVSAGETIRANQCWAVPADKVPEMLLVAATGRTISYFALD